MSDILISARQISKSYKTEKDNVLPVLKNVSLDIPANKISVLVGASGAGKSTLLHILGGLDKPEAGTVYYTDKSLYGMKESEIEKFRNRNMGFVFQFHHLLPEFNAVENVAIPMMIAGTPLKQAKENATKLLELVGLAGRLKHKPSELSGGEQQRVALARALANDPPVIFADEPTGNLDSQNGELIHNLFVKLRDELGKTFLIVTHNKDLMALADHVFSMKDGELTGQA